MTSIEKFELVEAKYERLMKEYGTHLLGAARRLTQNMSDAEDLYQETSIKIYLNLESCIDNNFKNWALKIMNNTFLDRVRYISRRPKCVSFDELTYYYGEEEREFDVADPKVNIEAEVMLDMVKNLRSAQVRTMINTLSPVYKESLSMSLYAQPTTPEVGAFYDSRGMDTSLISSSSGTPVGTINSRIFRARVALEKMASVSEWI